MDLEYTLDQLTKAELLRLFKSTKEFIQFNISVFNAGAVIRPICTNQPKTFGRNWNGYDFFVENDRTTNHAIYCALQNK